MPIAEHESNSRNSSAAKAALGGNTTPTYRLKLGDFEVTVLSDGYFEGSLDAFSVERSVGEALLRADFRPAGPAMRVNVNAYVVNTGRKLLLFDTGAVNGFAPTLSKLPERLIAAGFAPEAFDAVVMTHFHPDHIGGLTTAPGVARFSNAELVCNAAEREFWLNDAIMNQVPEAMKGFFLAARGALAAYQKTLRTFDRDGELLDGVSAVALPGHTPGHTGYFIASGGDSLLLWGDIVHAPALQFTRPEITVAFDTDPAQAVATRKAIFDRVAADRTLVAGMHLDFPAFSYVSRDGDGYRATPHRWRID